MAVRAPAAPPARAVRAGGPPDVRVRSPPHLHELVAQVAAPRAHALRTGARTACSTCAGGGAPLVRRFQGGDAATFFEFWVFGPVPSGPRGFWANT
ncbi:hypothetical protein F511_12267 [Dorcoceras hygrometricum]|uniref:Uncharacterized protein n=1 Tax=Dorcoceras hygrometricum TaxID=472368 RepID=A0A2Z7DEE5_9LAMI|nr:hypothetical protein F511_12267 [Dorcoceras hygrometricum]